MELIHAKSNFTFVKMNLINDFHDNIHRFGNIPIYSTE